MLAGSALPFQFCIARIPEFRPDWGIIFRLSKALRGVRPPCARIPFDWREHNSVFIKR
jgi:hypothetical protein